MDFELSDDQVALTDGIRALCEGRFDMDAVRAMADTGGIDRGRWTELAQTGVFSLALPEADGGVGLGWADATLVFEELGKAAVPGPLIATTLAAGLIEGASTGERIVGSLARPPAGEDVLIEHASVLDDLVLVDAAGLSKVEVASLDVEMLPYPLDPLTTVGRVTAPLGDGEQIGGPEDAQVWSTRGVVLRSGLQLGLAGAATELAVAYAKERQQFNKPIGQFQAIKHLCADMLSHLEVARAATYFAAVTLDDPEVGVAAHAASTAAIVTSKAADFCGRACVQIHGGMGYTWEVDAHLYLKRTWALDHSFGSSAVHAEAVAARL